MARIPDSEIERLKQAVSIERFVAGFGVELKRQGKDLFGRCPFHDDRTPSLSVTPGNESVALPGSVQHRGRCDRVGDEDARGEFPACGRTAERRPSLFSR